MSNAQLRKERTENNLAVLNNKIPSRVPISVNMGLNVISEYAGVDPRQAHWNPELLEKASEKLCKMIPSDISILGMPILSPSKYQALASKSIVLSESGFLQHPNTHMMEPEEYDEFIKDPYAFVVETAAPRTNKNLDFKADPARAMFTIHQADQVSHAIGAKFGAVLARLDQQFVYPAFIPGGGGGYAPMDILSDQLRSFSGMFMDIKRNRDKVKAAIDAIYPLNYKVSLPPDPKTYTRNAYGFYPLHMATFMREKDFAELWWPTFFRQWTDFASMGYRCAAFLEDDWTRYLDYVQDLPTGSMFIFEFGNPKLFKEKLGKKFILNGGFPVSYLTQLSKQGCIDKTKEWIDIMAPGGQYIFAFDKGLLTLSDCNIENLQAVVQTVLDEGKYSNAGETSGELFRQKDYSHSEYIPFESRMYKTFEQYRSEHPNTPLDAEKDVQAAEDAILKFYYSLMQ